MPVADVKLSGFKELDEMFQRLEQGPETEKIQRDALRAAGNVIRTELEAVTPIRKTTAHGQDLPEGALKEAIRLRTSIPKDGSAPYSEVDFGKLSYLAHIVDIGHADFNSGGRTHTPAHPFITPARVSSLPKATDAYIETMQAGINEVMQK